MSETTTEDARVYLIEKRGLYYRPEAKGYTGIKDEAGRYTLAEVAEYMPNMDSANQDGMSFIHEDEAPEYTRACYHDLKERHQAKKLEAAAARIEALERELAEAHAALDSIETSHGLTSNGNVWRFWAQEAKKYAAFAQARRRECEAKTQIIAGLERELAEANALPRMIKAVGDTIEQMRDNARSDPLYQHGDMVLVWANEGDINNRIFAHAAHRARVEGKG